MHFRMVLLYPLFAFLDRSAKFTILIQTLVSVEMGNSISRSFRTGGKVIAKIPLEVMCRLRTT
jgi:hypothetical protein